MTSYDIQELQIRFNFNMEAVQQTNEFVLEFPLY